MKKRKLEMFLEKVPSFSHPQVDLEQYRTPAPIAADVLFTAYQYHDIFERVVIDLGCGTGMFSVGASLLQAKMIIGLDVDKDCLTDASRFAREHGLNISFINQDVKDADLACDTVLMNPPFGAQKSNKHADRIFIQKALEIAPMVYSLHLTSTVPFIEKMSEALDAEITLKKPYLMPIKSTFFFHEKQVENFEVSLLRICRKK
jgi:putative methylase